MWHVWADDMKDPTAWSQLIIGVTNSSQYIEVTARIKNALHERRRDAAVTVTVTDCSPHSTVTSLCQFPLLAFYENAVLLVMATWILHNALPTR